MKTGNPKGSSINPGSVTVTSEAGRSISWPELATEFSVQSISVNGKEFQKQECAGLKCRSGGKGPVLVHLEAENGSQAESLRTIRSHLAPGHWWLQSNPARALTIRPDGINDHGSWLCRKCCQGYLDTEKGGKEMETPQRIAMYCFSCQIKTDTKEPREVVMKNGRYGVTGKCQQCSRKKFTTGRLANLQATTA